MNNICSNRYIYNYAHYAWLPCAFCRRWWLASLIPSPSLLPFNLIELSYFFTKCIEHFQTFLAAALIFCVTHRSVLHRTYALRLISRAIKRSHGIVDNGDKSNRRTRYRLGYLRTSARVGRHAGDANFQISNRRLAARHSASRWVTIDTNRPLITAVISSDFIVFRRRAPRTNPRPRHRWRHARAVRVSRALTNSAAVARTTRC